MGNTTLLYPPSVVYDQDQVIREIDGVRLEMLRLPGRDRGPDHGVGP